MRQQEIALSCWQFRPSNYDFFIGVSGTGVSGPLPANHEMMLFATSSSIARRVACDAEPTCGSSTTLSISISSCGTCGSSMNTSRRAATARGGSAQGWRVLVIAVLRPVSGAQIALGLRKMANGGEREAERRIGDLFVENVGRVGDDDAVLAGPFGVDVVIADAEARHD